MPASCALIALISALANPIAARPHRRKLCRTNPAKETPMSSPITVAGVTLDIEQAGNGTPLLFLHPGEGLQPHRPWIDLLARRYRVIAPHHPGWGNSALPTWLSCVDDLAYLYLDLADELELSDATLAGVDFGGWIAHEAGTRDTTPRA